MVIVFNTDEVQKNESKMGYTYRRQRTATIQEVPDCNIYSLNGTYRRAPHAIRIPGGRRRKTVRPVGLSLSNRWSLTPGAPPITHHHDGDDDVSKIIYCCRRGGRCRRHRLALKFTSERINASAEVDLIARDDYDEALFRCFDGETSSGGPESKASQ